MIQTVSAVPAAHTYNIINEQWPLAINRSVTTKPNKWFRAFHIKSGFYTLSSFFYYGERVKISFGLSEAYAGHYALIRGLLDFHRSKEYKFTYNNDAKTFDLSVSAGLLGDVHQYLENVTVWVDQELDFKRALKKVIQFEIAYKAKASEIYQLIGK